MPKTFSKRVESQRPDLKELCPELIKYVGDIKFKKHEIQIQELSLEFGETIFDHGEFKFPNLSSTKTFSFGLVLEHGFEVFLDAEDLSPFHLHTPGDIFLIDEARGIRHILPQEELNMTAGARSIALSAKINDSRCFECLVKHCNSPGLLTPSYTNSCVPGRLYFAIKISRAILVSVPSIQFLPATRGQCVHGKIPTISFPFIVLFFRDLWQFTPRNAGNNLIPITSMFWTV